MFAFHNEIKEWFDKPSQKQVDDDLEEYRRETQARVERRQDFYGGVFRKHVEKLIHKRMNLVHKNEYGVEDFNPFKKELEYFVDNVFTPEHKKWLERIEYIDRYDLGDEEVKQTPKWKKH